MSEKPLPFSNGLNLKVMGGVLVLILAVLIWRLTDAQNNTQRVLYVVAIVLEILFFVGLVFASRYIKRQHDRAQAAYQAQIAAARADAEGAPAAPSKPEAGETDAP
ncbi:hypothetical protein [Tsukamurella sp. PLM1]|uniref:hypothetical protein n=1 Tax=Tsukamurella sp. PLM1 TaxID=2929795 RepID=UPI0020566BBC|nr:hypothetical protein [Tsukamurella sp. PLM1]BDH56079.1 hypothetical protein MTP03_10180 [Tsukamurella sp. PLM1]